MDETAWLWHARYGHLNFRALQELGSNEMVVGLPRVRAVEQVCDGCALGKQHRSPFPRASPYRAKEALKLVHADLCGQISPLTPGGKSYFLLVVDDMSRYMWLELLATKDEAFVCFKKIKAAAEMESGRRLKAFRTDCGGEFNSGMFVTFCNDNGIKHNRTTPYTPQQNGVVERRNQTVVEMARCLLKSMNVPGKFWGEAVSTAVYLLNRAPTKSLNGKTPYEAWFGRKPGVKHLRTFGCTAHAKKLGPSLTKLTDRAIPGIFLGYESDSKGYRVFDPVKGRLMISRDVLFNEKKVWNWGESEQGDEATTVPMHTFTVELPDTIPGPTIDQDAELGAEASGNGAAPASPVSIPPQGSTGNDAGTPPATPIAGQGGSSPPGQIQFVSPPTGASADSAGNPYRYRTVFDLLESTDEVSTKEYSGLCLVAAEEPTSV